MVTRNSKLRARGLRILMAETGTNEQEATAQLEAASGDLRVAIVMSKTGCSRAEAESALAGTNGVVASAAASLLSANMNQKSKR
jgi:N-acetylmuramic acid 6-phosphate etherase